MKKRDFVKSFLATSIAHIFLAPLARAGSVGGFGGATELTQMANNVELANSYIKQAEAFALQFEQYQNMLQNTLNIPNQVWGMVMNDLSGIANLVKQGQALAYSSQNIGQQFVNTFKGFQFPSGFDFKTDYKKWSQTTLDSLKGALESANLQAQQFATEEGILSQLRSMSTSATGQMQAIQVGSQIAEQQVQQLQKLRQLMMLQLQSQNTYMAAQQQKQDTIQAAKQDAYEYRDPRQSNYQSFRGGSN